MEGLLAKQYAAYDELVYLVNKSKSWYTAFSNLYHIPIDGIDLRLTRVINAYTKLVSLTRNAKDVKRLQDYCIDLVFDFIEDVNKSIY